MIQIKKYNNGLVYLSRAPSTARNDSYIGERGSCLNERIVDYSGRNSKPQIARHFNFWSQQALIHRGISGTGRPKIEHLNF